MLKWYVTSRVHRDTWNTRGAVHRSKAYGIVHNQQNMSLEVLHVAGFWGIRKE